MKVAHPLMLRAIAAAKRPTRFLVVNDEGHGYAKKKNRDFLFVPRCCSSNDICSSCNSELPRWVMYV